MKKTLVLTLAVALAACGGPKGKSDSYASGRSSTNGVAMGKSFSSQARQGETVYRFAFDSSNISPAEVAEIRTHARYLVENPTARIRIEGHTDAKGSREYNIALGERRAKAVTNILLAEGVHKDQVAVVSYGKEKLLSLGTDAEAHQENRRAEIVYEAN